jgi:WD40 repeat protein
MTLASGTQDRTIKLWDVAGGMLSRPLGEEDHTKSVLSIAFGNEGKVLAAASGDGTVWLWDVVNKRKIDQLEGHTARVISVVFTPDGKALVSASGDGTVLLWGIK